MDLSIGKKDHGKQIHTTLVTSGEPSRMMPVMVPTSFVVHMEKIFIGAISKRTLEATRVKSLVGNTVAPVDRARKIMRKEKLVAGLMMPRPCGNDVNMKG